jgi:hypothetical protein
MNNKLIVFGLIALVAIAAMCTTPGSNQQQTQTTSNSQSSVTGEVLFNEKYTVKANSYMWNRMPLTKGTKVNITFETTDDKNLDMYIMTDIQYNWIYVYGTKELQKPNNYLKFYSGTKTDFQYTFLEDGTYYLVFVNTTEFPREFYYSGTIVSGSKLEDFDYVICKGTGLSFGREKYGSCVTYLQEGEKINIYYSVQQNEYRNRFIKMYVLDSNGFKSWTKSPYDYTGKIYFDSTNDRERSYEQFQWTAPEKGYYYFVFWNRDSPETLKLDYKVYKDIT